MKNNNFFLYPASILCLILLLPMGGFTQEQKPRLIITSPQDGDTITPGQEVTIVIEAVNGFVPDPNRTWLHAEKFHRRITTVPMTFVWPVPIELSGTTAIGVLGMDANKELTGFAVRLKIQQTATVESFELYDWDGNIDIYLDWNNNIKSRKTGNVAIHDAIYSDGVKREIPKEELAYTSSDPSIISIDNQGNYEVLKIGDASITVSAGNATQAFPLAFHQPTGIRPNELIPPTTTIDITPPANSAGWYNQDLTITLTAQDNEGGSGIQEVDWRFAGKGKGEYVKGDRAVVGYAIEGIKNFSYWSRDKEGNEDDNKIEINLDKTPPAITITSPIDQKEYPSGEAIPVAYTAADNLSGIASQAIALDGVDITGQTQVSPSAGTHALTVTATDKADNTANKEITFTVKETTKIKAEVTIKPEVFLRNKGVFLAFVKLPSPYQNEPITEASCDGAVAKKIIPCRHKGTILLFRRQDITEKPMDKTFVVTGKLKNGLFFEGTDTIKKVLSGKDFFKRFFPNKRDKDDEHKEFHRGIDNFCGKSREGEEAGKHIRDFDD